MNNFYDSGAYAPSYGNSVSDAVGGSMNSLSGIGVLSIILLVLLGITWLFLIAYSIYAYVFTSLSLHRISGRRNYSKPWLAWIPICNTWLFGEIASDYDSQNGKDSRWGRKLLTFYFLYCGFYIVGECLSSSMSFSSDPDLGALLIALLLLLIAFAFLIVYTVLYYICLYKIFKSTAENKAIVYFLISLFVPIAQPLCLFLCRNKGYPYAVEEPKNII